MKRFLVLLVALVILVGPVALAQEGPAYVNVFNAHTKLGHQAQYEAAVKKLWAAMKKSGADFPVFASQSTTTPGDYAFVTPLDNMATMDAQNEAFGKAFAQDGAALTEFGKHSNGNTSIVLATRPDLAYRPDNPRVTNEDGLYAHTMVLYVHPEHTQDMEAAIKAFGELSAKKGVKDGYGVSQNATGDGPVYRIRTLAKSQADYYAQQEKVNAALGEEGMALRNKVGPMIQKIENYGSVRCPDLSYQP